MTATWSTDAAAEVLATVTGQGPVLRALQALQESFGYVHPDAVIFVASHYNVSRADVYGVLTFYSDLRSTPPADVEVRVCMGEACQAVGARELLAGAQAAISAGCDVQHVYCMGNCALGPTAVINGDLIGRATVTAVAGAIDDRRRDAS
jgi:formate dehydrogenase subunit gamma